MTFSRLASVLLSSVFFLVPASPLVKAAEFDLTPAQDARLRQYLPNTYAKLLKRQPVHTVVIGDSVLNMYGYDADAGNALRAWGGVFIQELADQFLYTGGVRLVRPPKGQPEKMIPVFGPEITLQNFSRGGRLIFHATQPLTTVAFENKPSLVVVSYGINDANNNLQPEIYRQNVQQIVDLVHAQKADLVLCGPTVIMSDVPEQGIALTRPYSDIMKEVADANGVFFADLGDLSWLIRLDESKHPLDVPKKKVKEAETLTDPGTPAPATPAPVSAPTDPSAEPPGAVPPALVSPLAHEIDPDPDKKAMKVFQQVVAALKLHFNQGPPPDWLHPEPATQKILGRRVFQELINGPHLVPWTVGAATVTPDGPDKCTLSYRLENNTNEEQTFTLLPLVNSFMRPVDASAQITLKSGKKTVVNVTYTRNTAPTRQEQLRADLLPAGEPFLRLPVLVTSRGMARIEVVRATLTPVAVLWATGASFNQEGSSELTGRIVNTTDKILDGKWEATWMGQKWGGVFKVEARGDQPFKLPVRLPGGVTESGRQKGTVAFVVTVGANQIHFNRELEIVRNLALKETVALFPPGAYLRDEVVNPITPSPAIPSIGFRADADAKALYLTWDIYGMNLQDNPAGGGAMNVDINIDARSYGKRLNPGTTDVVRVNSAAADGDATVAGLPPWCFGTGYGMYYDEKQVKGRLSSRPDGSRRFTVTLPRAYLYLHEWAIGNGNSQIGINTTASIWQQDGGPAGTGANLPFTLTINGRHRDDAENLAVLELVDKGTGRWTVRLY